MDLENPEVYDKIQELFSDKEWRIRNLYYIKDKDGKKVLFEPNDAQIKFRTNKHNRNLNLKARQKGFTTEACIDALDDCLFNSYFNAGIIADTRENAEKIFTDKVKFAYDELPEIIRQVRPANTDKAGELRFSNKSSISVATSYRGGTLRKLHVSEFGKICAKTPEKAKEIVEGAFNAVPKDGEITIESTAEGKIGKFYEMCEEARTMERLGDRLTELDFKFHFHPWWDSKEYRIDPEGVVIPAGLETYFFELKDKFNINLDDAQKAWYTKMKAIQKDGMMKEYPSHPDEAFSQSVDGAYYGAEMAAAELDKRIGKVPWEPKIKVHTAWDLGYNDSTTIWFFQLEPDGTRRYIDYYENSGKMLSHYVAKLREKPYVYGKTILPHDAEVNNIQTGETRTQTLRDLGLNDIEVVPSYPGALQDGIDASRNLLHKCWFDQAKCARGIDALRQYRKEWDDKAGCWKSHPMHDWSSHAADSFRMSAMVDVAEIPMPTQRRAKNKYR